MFEKYCDKKVNSLENDIKKIGVWQRIYYKKAKDVNFELLSKFILYF